MKYRITVVIWLLALSLQCLACPFCNPGESDIFGDVADAQAVVLVDKVDTRKYKVTETLVGEVKLGRIVVAAEPQGKLGKAGQLVLTTAGPPNLPYWSDAPRSLTEEELSFCRQCIIKSKQPSANQWDFAAKYLQHSSSEISSAAYNLLAGAPLSEVQKRATLVGESKLRSWVKNNKIAPERRALYLLMCYQSWPVSDKDWLKQQLFGDELSSNSSFLGPLAVAYLHTHGAQGLPKLEQTFYKPELPAGRTTPLNRALTLVAEQTQDKALKSAVSALFIKELKHPNRGAFVLAPLALWQDSSASSEVEALFKKSQNVTWIKVAVIRYFRSFDTAESLAALTRLKAVDARLVDRTTDPYRRSDLGID